MFIVPRQRLAVSAKYLASYYYRLRCWAFPHPEREAFDQVVVMGYRQLEPRLDEEAQGQVLAWAEREPEPLYSQGYPIYTAITSDAGDILFATRTVDPVAAAQEARRSGLWASAEVTDSLWPSKDQRTRPLMPLRKGHMAMLIAAGSWTTSISKRTVGAFWSMGRPPRSWCWSRRPRTRRPIGRSSAPPSSPWTSGTA